MKADTEIAKLNRLQGKHVKFETHRSQVLRKYLYNISFLPNYNSNTIFYYY